MGVGWVNRSDCPVHCFCVENPARSQAVARGIAPCAAVVCARAFNMTKSWIVLSLENRLIYTKYHRKPDFHARWCAAGAWFTGGKVKNDAHSELEFVGCQV